MPLIDWFRRKPDAEERHFTTAGGASMFGLPSTAGIVVDEVSALQLSTVYACVRIISESVASLPINVFKETQTGMREAKELPVYDVLRHQVNDNITAFMFFELAVSQACLFGNSYSIIERNRAGQVTGLVPVEPAYVSVNLTESGKVAYRITTKTNDLALPAEDVLHIKGLGPNGLKGYSPIQLAKEAVGLGLAAEQYGAAYFGNAAMPSGVLSVPGKLSDEAFNNLRRSWENLHRGSQNSARVALLEGGVEFKPLTLPPNESQFLQTRKFQTSEIARIFRVPPTMLADLEGSASYGSIYELNRAFVSHTLTPWARRIENELEVKLLPSKEYAVQFQFEELLRGDQESRFRSYQLARQAGFLSINDIRKQEALDPIGTNGDEYLSPLNMERLRAGDSSSEQPQERAEYKFKPIERSSGREKIKPELNKALRTITDFELQEVREYLASNDQEGLRDWAEEFYTGRFQRQAFTMVLPAIVKFSEVVRSSLEQEIGALVPLQEETLRNMADRFSIRRSVRSKQNLSSSDIESTLEYWAEEKVDEIIESEVRRFEGTLQLEFFRQAEVPELVWSSEDWPELNGRTVKTGEPFVKRGEELTSKNGETYVARTDIRHTPLNSKDQSTMAAKRGN